MFGLIFGFMTVARSMKRAWADDQFRASATALLILLGISTLFFALTEDWSVLDAFYFSVVSVTTTGLGDFAPTTAAGKVFMILYLVLGIGLAVGVVATLGSAFVAERQQAAARRQERRRATNQ
jgi:hypothetical protein